HTRPRARTRQSIGPSESSRPPISGATLTRFFAIMASREIREDTKTPDSWSLRWEGTRKHEGAKDAKVREGSALGPLTWTPNKNFAFSFASSRLRGLPTLPSEGSRLGEEETTCQVFQRLPFAAFLVTPTPARTTSDRRTKGARP